MTRRLVALLAAAAFAAAPTAAAAAPADGDAAPRGYEPRFEAAACPAIPIPLPVLDDARCGYLVVPENRSRPAGTTIRLAVAIVPAVAERPWPDPTREPTSPDTRCAATARVPAFDG